ncbi:hypothetical protein EYF80_013861 [Liparis tanakae]|uniref:Uncharacterized protein n=1 Tax=Liparis tanakae TaxID=230148 RepID=A0A4Z2IDS1_9TELE|nr:hypothetical protein EYF80_013861 [Liparis tanakae]
MVANFLSAKRHNEQIQENSKPRSNNREELREHHNFSTSPDTTTSPFWLRINFIIHLTRAKIIPCQITVGDCGGVLMNEAISQSLSLSAASWTRQPQGSGAAPEGKRRRGEHGLGCMYNVKACHSTAAIENIHSDRPWMWNSLRTLSNMLLVSYTGLQHYL